MSSYSKRIQISNTFLGGCSIDIGNTTVSNKECYLLSLIWEYAGDEIKQLIRAISKIKRDNKKVLSDIKEDISSPLLSEEL